MKKKLEEMTLEDAMVLMKWLSGLGYPTKPQMELYHKARQVFAEHAQRIENEYKINE